jgi:predicted transcriptional regulator
MLSKRINCLPVVDDSGNICGIITSTDLLKSYRAIQESVEKQNALDLSIARDADVER